MQNRKRGMHLSHRVLRVCMYATAQNLSNISLDVVVEKLKYFVVVNIYG